MPKTILSSAGGSRHQLPQDEWTARCVAAAVRSNITVAQVVRSGRRLRPILRAPCLRPGPQCTKRVATRLSLISTRRLPACTCWNDATNNYRSRWKMKSYQLLKETLGVRDVLVNIQCRKKEGVIRSARK